MPPSGRMPGGSFFFDSIIRQQPFDEDSLDPEHNLEEFTPIGEGDLAARSAPQWTVPEAPAAP